MRRGAKLPAHFDEDPETIRLRGLYHKIPSAEWRELWKAHVEQYVQSTLEQQDLTTFRSQRYTGAGAEGYEGKGFFVSLSRIHAGDYAHGGEVITQTVPKGTRVYIQHMGLPVIPIDDLRRMGYRAILRPDLNEMVLFK